MPKTKYYVVWKGRRTGVFASWAECEAQVKAFPGAEYKAFDSRAEADRALSKGYEDYKGRPSSAQKWLFAPHPPLLPSLCVDAACSGSPGPLEYRGVMAESGQQIFRAGPFRDGTNNVGEFLAIVDAVQWLQSRHQDWPIYSDSENAIGWVKAGKCNTKLARLPSNRKLFERIALAEGTLKVLRSPGSLTAGQARILKWDTRAWGENPADFGRK